MIKIKQIINILINFLTIIIKNQKSLLYDNRGGLLIPRFRKEKDDEYIEYRNLIIDKKPSNFVYLQRDKIEKCPNSDEKLKQILIKLNNPKLKTWEDILAHQNKKLDIK